MPTAFLVWGRAVLLFFWHRFWQADDKSGLLARQAALFYLT
ncbi:hypothetical protein MCEMIH15_01020 [Caulobacteraceae bacterium]